MVYADLDGFGLSELGREQATAARDRLAVAPLRLVVTSPLQRAHETAAAIASPHGLVPIVDHRLTEWGLATRWAGVRWEDLPSRFPGELEAYLDHPHNLSFTPETIDEVAERMVAAVADHVAHHSTLVVVAHQDPVQAARLALTRRALDELPADKPGHASVITIRWTSGEWRELGVWEPPQS